MHLSDGELRAYQDHELSSADRQRIQDHLAGCTRCREHAGRLLEQTRAVEDRLAALVPGAGQGPLPVKAARVRLQARNVEKENTQMLKRIFSRPYRPAWAALAVVALLAIALAFPPVQAIANSFLGLFRVQQVQVIQINPGNLPQQLGSSAQLELMFAEDVQVEGGGEPYAVDSAEQASAEAGIPIRLPAKAEEAPALKVQPGGQAVLTVDQQRLQAILNEIGRADIQLPAGLDGAEVKVTIPTGVLAQYGNCEPDPRTFQEGSYDPDDAAASLLSECTTLLQMPSPTIEAPEGLDVAAIGEAFLQVVGMSPEEAGIFSSNVDWSTTLVVPIPRYGTVYEEVSVDGAAGTFIGHNLENHTRQYMLLWIKGDLLHILTGPGDRSTALRIANSLK